MMNLTRILSALIEESGITVGEVKGSPLIHWSLYTQGSGVCFGGNFSDYSHLIDQMFRDGELDRAVIFKDLVDNHDLRVKIVISSGRYTHANMMDLEFDGPSTDEFDPDVVEAVIKSVEDAFDTLKHRVSTEAEDLLLGYFDIWIHEEEVVKSYKTENFKVELLRLPSHEDVKSWQFDLLDPSEALEGIRALMKANDCVGYDLGVRLYRRSNRDGSSHWEREQEASRGGGIYGKEDRQLDQFRELVAETFDDFRAQTGTTKLKQLKEAA